jgi:hypothetical protein
MHASIDEIFKIKLMPKLHDNLVKLFSLIDETNEISEIDK